MEKLMLCQCVYFSFRHLIYLATEHRMYLLKVIQRDAAIMTVWFLEVVLHIMIACMVEKSFMRLLSNPICTHRDHPAAVI